MRRAAVQPQGDEDVPGQLMLFDRSFAGRVVSIDFDLHFADATDPAAIHKIEDSARRLRRGVIAGAPKARRAARLMGELAGLFDGR